MSTHRGRIGLAHLANKVRVRISAINDSHAATPVNATLAWSTAYPAEATAGSAVYNADSHLWEATAKFTGLLPLYGDFGRRQAREKTKLGCN